MMDIQIQFDAVSQAILRNIRSLSERGLSEALLDATNTLNQEAIGSIILNRMTGPSSVSAGVLGRVTGTAGRSLNAPPATLRGNTIESRIGTNERYVKAHEVGFLGAVGVRGHTRRVESRSRFKSHSRSGKVYVKLRQVAQGVAFVRQHTRNVNVPARHMIQQGLADYAPQYSARLSDAVIKTWNGVFR